MSVSVRPIIRPRRKNTLRDHITEAIKNRKDIDFKFVRMLQHREILDKFIERFIEQGQLGWKRHHWPWEVFRHQAGSSQPKDVMAVLEKRLSPAERYWFIASDSEAKYWVADAAGSGIVSTLREMYSFEYYIMDRKMTWMLCENHHGMLIESILPPERRMTKTKK